MGTLDPIAHIQSHREMYLPDMGGIPVSIYLAQRLSSDAMVLGASKVDLSQIGEWWTISSDTDWLAKPCECALDRLFNQIIPFPEAGPNSMRSEVLLTAFARDIVTSRAEETKRIKGESHAPSPSVPPRQWARTVSFRV